MPRRNTGGFLSTKEQATDANSANGIFTTQEAAALTAVGSFPTGRFTPSRSLRFRVDANPYFYRTPPIVPTAATTFTMSFWFKRGVAYDASYNKYIYSSYETLGWPSSIAISGDQLQVLNCSGGSQTGGFTTSRVFRDPAAWYHIVWVWDTTNPISSERQRFYINGVRDTALASVVTPSLNAVSTVNKNGVLQLYGYYYDYLRQWGGNLAELHMLDGTALDASHFGQTDAETGTWIPKRYTGSASTYGNNGYYLPFSNPTQATDITSTATATAPFGGTVGSITTANGVYLTTNTSAGSTFTVAQYDFGAPVQISQFLVGALYFTGGSSTFQVQTSNDGSTWVSSGSLSVTGSGQNFYGVINIAVRYVRLQATAFGTNGQAVVDCLLLYRDGITEDASGTGNNLTPVNFSTTSGVTYDSLVDVPGIAAVSNQPDVGGVQRGNYATLNPLFNGGYTLSEGNLYANGSSAITVATMGIPPGSGKFYWEVTASSNTTTGSYIPIFGIASLDGIIVHQGSAGTPSRSVAFYTDSGSGYSAQWYENGTQQKSVSIAGLNGSAAGTVWQFAYDSNTGNWWIGKNNTWGAGDGSLTGNPSSGSNPVITIPPNQTMAPYLDHAGTSSSFRYNFGQRPFAYTPPTGFKTLNTTNLPTPVIKRPSDHFDVKTYTGLGQDQTIGVTAKQTTTARIPGSAKFKASQAAYMTKTPVIPAASGGSLATVYNYTISSDTNNYSLYNVARSAGYDGKSLATFNLTINAGVVVGSVSSLFPALDLSGFPSGVAINLTVGSGAYVVGAGGAGGNGSGWPGTGGTGIPGGDAIWASAAVSITNNGTVAGGGGGGGGSEGWAPNGNYGIGGGGGGGGAGRIVGTFGNGVGTSAGGTPGSNGGAGTLTTGGTAGPGGYHSGYTAGAGGAGGNLGTAGTGGAGSPGNWNGSNYNPGAGGAAGYYVRGASNVTWATTGTRLGSTQVSPQKYSGSGTTWTWSAWVKRTTTGATQRLFTCANASGDDTAVRFETDKVRFYNSTQVAGGSVFDIKSSRDYADTNWHHIVAVCDTTNALSFDRVRLYVDGARIADMATQSLPGVNQISTMNWNIPQYLGIYPVTLTDEKFDGYMAEVNFVDGLALDSSSFGNFDANNNWMPRTYTGTYGAAGYYLPFTGQSLGAQSYSTPTFGSNSHYLSVADNAALDMGASDFTMECYYYPTMIGTAGTAYSICGKRTAGTYGGFLFHAGIDQPLRARVVATFNGSTWGVDFSSSIDFLPYVWNHVALTRSGSTWTIWVNGQRGGTATASGTIPDNSAPFVIGNSSVSDSALLTGKISNFRLVKGSALYSAPFTPPTTALTAVTNTVLLTCQNATYTDNSTNNFTVTANLLGAPQIQYPFTQNPTYSAYFTTNRSLGVTGFTPNFNTTTNFTIEFWAYVNSFSTNPLDIAGGGTGSTLTYVYNTGSVGIGINGTNEIVTPAGVITTNTWNHYAFVRNGTNLTIYINGIAQSTTSSATTYLSNNANAFFIGNRSAGGTGYPFNGYISNFRVTNTTVYTGNFNVPFAPLTAISGTQLLTCADAGLRDLSTNNYVITNTNYVNPSQQPVPPASTGLGADGSGTTNHWAIGNMNIAAGEAYQDWNNDVPSDYDDNGDIHGTYCILDKNNTGSYVTVANGGMSALGNSASNSAVVLGNMEVSTGKWYWEYTNDVMGINYAGIGKSINPAQNNAETYAIADGNTKGCSIRSSGGALYTGWGGDYIAASSFSTPSFTKGDVIGVALDLDNGALYFHKNGSWMNSGSPTSGLSKTGALHAWSAGQIGSVKPLAGGYTPSVTHVNFGQQKFKFVPPTGFKSLNTKNISDIGASRLPNTYGNFVNTPDLVWIKGRSASSNHTINDTVRGIKNYVLPNTNGGQGTDGSVLGFNPNGFQLGTDAGVSFNNAGATYVSWNWNRGTIPGFDIVTYSGNGTNGRMIPHNLGQVPAMYFTKCLSTYNNVQGFSDWSVYHKDSGASAYGGNKTVFLTTNIAAGAAGGYFNNPTSTAFGPNQINYDNSSGQPYIAYLWAEVPGFSKFGSYLGNGSADGPFVYTGFRPRWIMIKQITAAGYDWLIYDSVRDTYNGGGTNLRPNQTYVDGAETANKIDLVSNGFKIRGDSSGSINSANTHIYAAFAEAPFKYANAR